MKSNKKNLGLLASGLVMATVGLTNSSFAATPIGSGGEIRSEIVTPNAIQNNGISALDFKNSEAKCGEEGKSKGDKGKSGDAKCGEKGKSGDAKCGEKGKSGDAKCGEKGKSGDAKCGEKGKSGDAKCGEK